MCESPSREAGEGDREAVEGAGPGANRAENPLSRARFTDDPTDMPRLHRASRQQDGD